MSLHSAREGTNYSPGRRHSVTAAGSRFHIATACNKLRYAPRVPDMDKSIIHATGICWLVMHWRNLQGSVVAEASLPAEQRKLHEWWGSDRHCHLGCRKTSQVQPNQLLF